jgi:biopolymer transport protein ExbB/TolQ
VKKLLKLFTKKSKKLLEMPMLQKMTIISSLVSLGTLVGLLGTVAGMIKAFGALAAAEHQIKQLLQLVFLKHLLILQLVLELQL